MESFQVSTRARTDFVDITAQVERAVRASGAQDGICLVFVPHTTCGITINENADPSVREDIAQALDRLIPWSGPYRHSEGNSAAHIKASLLGNSVYLPLSRGRLALGTWQGVFLCEFDGPRTRTVRVSVVA